MNLHIIGMHEGTRLTHDGDKYMNLHIIGEDGGLIVDGRIAAGSSYRAGGQRRRPARGCRAQDLSPGGGRRSW